jgi:hypothetical protein
MSVLQKITPEGNIPGTVLSFEVGKNEEVLGEFLEVSSRTKLITFNSSDEDTHIH